MGKLRVFRVGDVVMLNSGGPAMVVQDVFPSPDRTVIVAEVGCTWIADGVKQQARFPMECVRLYKEPKEKP